MRSVHCHKFKQRKHWKKSVSENLQVAIFQIQLNLFEFYALHMELKEFTAKPILMINQHSWQ